MCSSVVAQQKGPMVGVLPHGTNRVRVGPPTLKNVGAYGAPKHLYQIWGPATCRVVHVCPPRISKVADGGTVELVKSL